jgi:hypothetical protein
MTNQAWECPRCKRINAPFNPSCFCSPENDLTIAEKDLLDKIKKPLFSFDEVDQAIKNSRCTNCGSYHGIFQGRAVQCVDLQNGITPTYCNGQAVAL